MCACGLRVCEILCVCVWLYVILCEYMCGVRVCGFVCVRFVHVCDVCVRVLFVNECVVCT